MSKVRQQVGLGQALMAEYPPLPDNYAPSLETLAEAFLQDFELHEKWLLRELRMVTSSSALAVDHQRQVVKRARFRGEESVGTSGQTLTVVGDRNLVLGVYCVPNTSGEWVAPAMAEICSRHTELPPLLYVDCQCCNGLVRRSKPSLLVPSAATLKDNEWKAPFRRVILDGLHLIMRLGKVLPNHPRKNTLLAHMGWAVY